MHIGNPMLNEVLVLGVTFLKEKESGGKNHVGGWQN